MVTEETTAASAAVVAAVAAAAAAAAAAAVFVVDPKPVAPAARVAATSGALQAVWLGTAVGTVT